MFLLSQLGLRLEVTGRSFGMGTGIFYNFVAAIYRKAHSKFLKLKNVFGSSFSNSVVP